jgi:hypothetical protein
VARLLEILQRDGLMPEIDSEAVDDPSYAAPPTVEFGRTDQKRSELGVFLERRRQLEA